MTGGSEGKEEESNTHQGGFHMSPDMDSIVNKVEDEWVEVESDRQGQGGFQIKLHNFDIVMLSMEEGKEGEKLEMRGKGYLASHTLLFTKLLGSQLAS